MGSGPPSTDKKFVRIRTKIEDLLQSGVILLSLFVSGCGDASGNGSDPIASETAWSGTKQVGVTGTSTESFALTTDSSRYVYAVGATTGDLSSQDLTGTQDAFVTKYNRSGELLWTKLLGDTSAATTAFAVAVDPSDQVIVAGKTEGNLAGTLVGVTDFFVAKYDSSGTKLWTAQLGTSGQSTIAYGVTTDSSGYIYVVGETDGNLDGNTLTGSVDFFVTQLNSSGSKLWTKTLGATAGSTTSARGVATDSSGNIYVSGFTTQALDGNTLTGTTDFFLTKYNSSGIKQWTKQLGAAGGLTAAYGVKVDASGNIFVGGKTTGYLDSNTLDGDADMFVTKYNASGVKQWTRQLGALNVTVNAQDIAVDSVGNVYITGDVDGNLDGNTLSGVDDLFVTKYSSTGVKQWTQTVGGTFLSSAFSRGIALDSTGNIFVSGRAEGGIDDNNSIGTADYFVTKFNSAGTLQ